MAWCVRRVAEDEFGEIRPYQEVAKDVGVDLSGWDLSSIGQKRGMGIVISLKTGLDPWIPKDKIGTYIAGKDIITPDEVPATQIHEHAVLEEINKRHKDRWARNSRRNGRIVDSRLTSLDNKVSSLDDKLSASRKLMMIMARQNGVDVSVLESALPCSDSDEDPMDRDLYDDDSDPESHSQKQKWTDDNGEPISAGELKVDELRAEACARYPQGAAQILNLRGKAELIWVIGQIYDDGLFVALKKDVAKQEKMQPRLFDENSVVCAVQDACHSTKEGCVVVGPAENKPAKVKWSLPPWKENMGVDVHLQAVFGTAQAALKSLQDLVSPQKRRRGDPEL